MDIFSTNLSQSKSDSHERFKQMETVIATTSVCDRRVLRDGNKSRNRFYKFPTDCEEAMGRLRRWKYEMNKSIVHSWESGGVRARYNRNSSLQNL